MLKYINKQLSVKELHEVEKHLLDCEFCSDAMAGMKYAQNSSMIFAIDNQIDQRVRTNQSKTPIMRNLMVAASLLIIVFGSYFTVNHFQNTVNNEPNLALNNEEKSEEKKLEDTGIIDGKANEEPVTISSNIVPSVAPVEQQQRLSEESEPVLDAFAEVVEDDEEILEIEDAETDVTIMAPEEEVTGNKWTVTETDKIEDLKKDAETDYRIQTSNGPDNKNKDRLTNTALGKTSQELSNNRSLESVAVKAESKKKRKVDNKKRYKSKNQAAVPNYEFQSQVIEDADASEDNSKQTTITLSSFKVVDYIDEYQKEYDLRNTVETKSVSAGFETEDDMESAEKEREELEVAVTYKATLEKAMALYKAKKYTLALEQFSIILNEHSDEVNGLFYGGLSNYHLSRYDNAKKNFSQVLDNEKTEFNQEAKWYKTLTLIELKEMDEAKQLLNEIIKANGFYKIKAEQKLKELK